MTIDQFPNILNPSIGYFSNSISSYVIIVDSPQSLTQTPMLGYRLTRCALLVSMLAACPHNSSQNVDFTWKLTLILPHNAHSLMQYQLHHPPNVCNIVHIHPTSIQRSTCWERLSSCRQAQFGWPCLHASAS